MTTSTLPPAYCLTEELRQYMSFPPGQEQDDVDLQRALDAGKAWIDWFTGRTFGVQTAVARVYPAVAPDLVPVVDLRSTAPTVEVDEAGDRTFTLVLTAAQYQLTPLAGPPFDTVRMWALPAGGAAPVELYDGTLVRVTGDWGYADSRGRTPANVAQANLLLAARWFKRREVPFSVLAVPELGSSQTVPAQDADVPALLFAFCRPGSPGAALLTSTAPDAAAPAGAAAWVMV